MKIGIDFGGVLAVHDKPVDKNTEHVNTDINMPGAIESLKILKSQGHQLFLVSFAGKRRSAETHNSITENKEISDLFDKLYFVKRPNCKQFVCDFENLDILIDDREDILKWVKNYTPEIHTILFDNWENVMKVIAAKAPTNYTRKTTDISTYLQILPT
jgi:hypothetical protein